jgi:hypothetical protein
VQPTCPASNRYRRGFQTFSVHWTNLSVPGLTGGRVLVDGNNCDGQILARGRRPTSTSMGGMNETTTSVWPFVFASLHVTGLRCCSQTARLFTDTVFADDDDAVSEMNVDERLGTIDIEIWKVEKNDVGPAVWSGMAAPQPKTIHERSKEAATQQITSVTSSKPLLGETSSSNLNPQILQPCFPRTGKSRAL